MSDKRCLTPEEYALERRISVRTVYRLIKTRKLPAERIGAQWRIWLRVSLPNAGQQRTAPPLT